MVPRGRERAGGVGVAHGEIRPRSLAVMAGQLDRGHADGQSHGGADRLQAFAPLAVVGQFGRRVQRRLAPHRGRRLQRRSIKGGDVLGARRVGHNLIMTPLRRQVKRLVGTDSPSPASGGRGQG